MNAVRKAYAPIDVHAAAAPADGSLWPSEIPALTGAEAVRAGRRLWRFAMGSTFAGDVFVTSGNRYSAVRWRGNARAMYVNPDRGWKNLLHELSHVFVYLANDGAEKPHSKFHARFEARLVREVIRRGWLDGRLRDKPKAAVAPADALAQKRALKLQRIDAALVRWDAKLRRAQKAMAKLSKQRRYYEKVAGGGVA